MPVETDKLLASLDNADSAAIGATLQTVILAARRNNIDADGALSEANRRFIERFNAVERASGDGDMLALDRAAQETIVARESKD